MLVYKFKISFEDHDDFLREIELRADQSFEDFHQAILGNLGLDPGMLASFFICDYRYRKKQEIQLNRINSDQSEEEDSPQEGNAPVNKVLLMHDSLLKDHIDDPHQRLTFVYDNLNQWTFYIELMKIMPGKADRVYPQFSRTVGPVPRELQATPKQIPGVETPMDFSYGAGLAPPEDLSDFDQIEGGEDYYGDETGYSGNEFQEEN